MPTTIISQNWDGVTAPALPSGFTYDAGFVTSTTVAVSGANSLKNTSIGSALYSTIDSNSGGVISTATMRVEGGTDGIAGPIARASAASAPANYYSALLRIVSADGLTLYKTIAGANTVLGRVGGSGTFAAGSWYKITLTANGTALSVRCQRVSDSLYLNSSGVWAAPAVDATTATDASITGAGYHGVRHVPIGGNTVYSDDYLLESLAVGLSASPTNTTSDATAITAASGAAGGTAPYTYVWHRSTTSGFTAGAGTVLSGQTSATLNDTTAVAGVVYYYKVVVTDAVAATATSSQIIASLFLAPKKVGFIGDSITDGTLLAAPLTEGPVPQFDALMEPLYGLQSVTTNEQGQSGATTALWVSGSAYLVAAKAAFASAGVTHAMVMLGTNDARDPNHVTAATYKTNLSSMCNDLVAAGYKVVLNYPPYAFLGSAGGLFDAAAMLLIYEYQAKIDELVNGSTILRGDRQAYIYFAEHAEFYNADALHLNALGSTQLARLWSKAFIAAVEATGGSSSIFQSALIRAA